MNEVEIKSKELQAANLVLSPQTAREQRHCEFIATWETHMPQMSKAEMMDSLSKTSPHHPSENMRWLYDRLLGKLAEKENK